MAVRSYELLSLSASMTSFTIDLLSFRHKWEISRYITLGQQYAVKCLSVWECILSHVKDASSDNNNNNNNNTGIQWSNWLQLF